MVRKPGLILIMVLLLAGAATTGIDTAALVLMGTLTVIAILVASSQDRQQE